MFGITGVFGFLQPFVPLYLAASGLSKGEIGLVAGLGTGAALLIQRFLGRLSDRFGTRRPFMFLAAVFRRVRLSSLPFRGRRSPVHASNRLRH
jgi:MFS family permease